MRGGNPLAYLDSAPPHNARHAATPERGSSGVPAARSIGAPADGGGGRRLVERANIAFVGADTDELVFTGPPPGGCQPGAYAYVLGAAVSKLRPRRDVIVTTGRSITPTRSRGRRPGAPGPLALVRGLTTRRDLDSTVSGRYVSE